MKNPFGLIAHYRLKEENLSQGLEDRVNQNNLWPVGNVNAFCRVRLGRGLGDYGLWGNTFLNENSGAFGGKSLAKELINNVEESQFSMTFWTRIYDSYVNNEDVLPIMGFVHLENPSTWPESVPVNNGVFLIGGSNNGLGFLTECDNLWEGCIYPAASIGLDYCGSLHHVTVTYDEKESNMSMYVNGKNHVVNANGSAQDWNSHIKKFDREKTYMFVLGGAGFAVANLKVFNRVLNQDDVVHLFHEESGF